ncbi:transmembrane protease serine 9-like [Oppia nitens]|uniref:transmembrane protease serine 9-like n=1 Tax=Oppia nitens TaxID=1686743 RepID=UPI0023DC4C95|nr:transmembrane protease serine 9-like [Oppia nitens]
MSSDPTITGKQWLNDDLDDSVRDNYMAEIPVSARVSAARKETNIKFTFGNTSVQTQSSAKAIKVSPNNCGLSTASKFIVNGTRARQGEFPWIVAIWLRGRYHCCGSLINKWWIISAAHCFDQIRAPDAYQIGLGSTQKLEAYIYLLDRIIVHSRYNYNDMKASDIALAKLAKPIEYTEQAAAVCLPTFPYEEPKYRQFYVAGWGRLSYFNPNIPNELQVVKLDLDQINHCAQAYQPQTIYYSQLCTLTQNKDACSGDSGGPLVEYINGRAVLVGIVSFGLNCADIRYPGVYTKVSYFLSWIQRNINEKTN